MPAQKDEKQNRSRQAPEAEKWHASIGKQILGALGVPANLRAVQVRRLWDNHYRVNVLLGDGIAAARIANSYFLVTDGDGTIVTSTPEIRKQY